MQRQMCGRGEAGNRRVEHRDRHLAITPGQGLQGDLIADFRVRHGLPRGLGRCGERCKRQEEKGRNGAHQGMKGQNLHPFVPRPGDLRNCGAS